MDEAELMTMSIEGTKPILAKRNRLLLIDDDPVVTEILLMRIARSCPTVVAEAVAEPVAMPGYDIYVVDVNFGERQEGVRLAEAISIVSPGATVFMLSSFLDVGVLKRAMGVQCRGAYDKREPDDLAALMLAISDAASGETSEAASEPPRRRGLLGDLAALIREWNRRISAEQSRGADVA
jgi:DNA-binding NarL/FixJ family response regulator